MDATLSSTISSQLIGSIYIDWNLILEFIKVLVWPAVIVVFRKNIAGLIDRLTEFKGPGGTEVKAKQQEQQLTTSYNPEISKEKITEKVKKEYEEKIKEAGKNIQETNKLLIQTQIYLDFERIYRLIFGSQIDFLKKIKSNLPEGLSIDDAITHYVLIIRIFPTLKSWTYYQYLEFLFNNNLIYQDHKRYLLTDKGKAFLAYYEALNLPPKGL